ncbi:hypothetical protein C2845_PM15G06080 [Panicum miliaceum]|uniref:Uncharacterized protein n=1 Tax=Panicum miliaceum TaxID=4540 RepID=A0A3L6QCT6_PANMI|nr:hypothetical protein C2845_PM15G06080 [Panicum miliaceum]
MSTCSTATSALRGHESRGRPRRVPPPAHDAGVVEAVHGRLERRLVDLERDWDAYKTGRSGAPRHRRSRSATGTPSSAVTTVAAPEADGLLLLLPLYRCSSPRRLVSSLQQTGSADSDCTAKIISGAAGDSYTGPSSVCSVEAGYSVAAYSSSACSRPCRCQCGVCYSSYSTSSSCTGAAAPPFSSAAGGTAGEHARKSDGGRWWAAGRAAWISAIALVVVVFVAMVVLELSVDEGCAEYLVPT